MFQGKFRGADVSLETSRDENTEESAQAAGSSSNLGKYIFFLVALNNSALQLNPIHELEHLFPLFSLKPGFSSAKVTDSHSVLFNTVSLDFP